MFVSGDNTPCRHAPRRSGTVPMFLVSWHIGTIVPIIYMPLGLVLAPAALIAGKR